MVSDYYLYLVRSQISKKTTVLGFCSDVNITKFIYKNKFKSDNTKYCYSNQTSLLDRISQQCNNDCQSQSEDSLNLKKNIYSREVI